MPQTQDTTPHPVTVYRHGANLSLCYPSMWNVTLEYTATHFNVLGETRPGNPSPTFHTHQRTFNLMLSWWSTVGSSVESTVPTGSWTRDLWCANPVRYPLAHSHFPPCIQGETQANALVSGIYKIMTIIVYRLILRTLYTTWWIGNDNLIDHSGLFIQLNKLYQNNSFVWSYIDLPFLLIRIQSHIKVIHTARSFDSAKYSTKYSDSHNVQQPCKSLWLFNWSTTSMKIISRRSSVLSIVHRQPSTKWDQCCE